VAREVSLYRIPCHGSCLLLNRACASSTGHQLRRRPDRPLGNADVVLAGGVESLSDIPILHSKRMSHILMDASKARSLGQRLAIFPGSGSRI
jgi:acetyl-CoA acetyltransferase